LPTETREQRIRRWRSYGHTQKAIAQRLGISTYQVRKALA
jgi:DNA-binding CsgD family transcriptional regulator